MQLFKRILPVIVAALLCVLLLPIASAQTERQPQTERQQGQPNARTGSFADRSDFPRLSESYVRGERALEKLGHRLPAVAAAHDTDVAELRSMLRRDRTLFVDGTGQLVYFDELSPYHLAEPSLNENTFAGAEAFGPEFELASLPGATKTIFLDFNGHVTEGTSWNSQNQIASINSPAFDRDGNVGSFSANELDIIARTWAVVAEDFAPWNVNVTTIDPGANALRRAGRNDQEWGVRVVITDDNAINCGCGGGAYIGAFDDATDEPVFIFNNDFIGISEAISHEVGHSMLLAHDGDSNGEYYRGHDGNGLVGWAPIMGSSYWEPLTHWSQQEFTGANNAGADANFGFGGDDIAILSSLTNGNNFGLRSDDHGDTVASATAIADLTAPTAGLIGTRSDLDIFTFSTTGGVLDLSANPANFAPNLDISLTLRDQGGAVVAASNPSSQLAASLVAELPAGAYSIEVDGAGAGAPTASTPSGYTDYASLGRYTLIGSMTLDQSIATVPGDVSCDGNLGVIDALTISQFSVGNRTATDQCPPANPATEIYAAAADMNGDDRVSILDAVLVSQCAVGLDNGFCSDS